MSYPENTPKPESLHRKENEQLLTKLLTDFVEHSKDQLLLQKKKKNSGDLTPEESAVAYQQFLSVIPEIVQMFVSSLRDDEAILQLINKFSDFDTNPENSDKLFLLFTYFIYNKNNLKDESHIKFSLYNFILYNPNVAQNQYGENHIPGMVIGYKGTGLQSAAIEVLHHQDFLRAEENNTTFKSFALSIIRRMTRWTTEDLVRIHESLTTSSGIIPELIALLFLYLDYKAPFEALPPAPIGKYILQQLFSRLEAWDYYSGYDLNIKDELLEKLTTKDSTVTKKYWQRLISLSHHFSDDYAFIYYLYEWRNEPVPKDLNHPLSQIKKLTGI